MRGWPDSISTCPRSNVSHATVGAALALRQVAQWQMMEKIGSPEMRNRIAEQRQPPSLICMVSPCFDSVVRSAARVYWRAHGRHAASSVLHRRRGTGGYDARLLVGSGGSRRPRLGELGGFPAGFSGRPSAP